MNCPRCKAPLGTLTDPDKILTCPGCGTRLVTRSAASRRKDTNPPAASRTPPPPATPPPPVTPPPPRHTPSPRSPEAAPTLAETLESLLLEMRALRAGQERVLALLQRGAAQRPDHEDEEQPPALAPIRARSRKSVVLIDDDEATRQAAVTELQQADVPVRAFADGNSAISGIAEQKPDVIVLELGLDGSMAGKDVINMIKATMEWVDIPIVLWTRQPVANQKEARQIHGADEIVAKSAGAGALVGRVINIFRRG